MNTLEGRDGWNSELEEFGTVVRLVVERCASEAGEKQ